METGNTNLAGKLLIAMPGMGDPRFDHAVVFVCAHSEEGTMGLAVNKPAGDISFSDLLEQLGIAAGPEVAGRQIFFGGPVEMGRGFVLHSGEYSVEAGTLKVNQAFAMTATRDVLEDIASGSGPGAALAALGYAGWGPGQLEDEIARNAWLIADADPELVFDPDHGGKWEAALARLGISPLMLSAEGGRA